MGSKRALQLIGSSGSCLHEVFMNTSPPQSATVVTEMGTYSVSHYSKQGFSSRNLQGGGIPCGSAAARRCDSRREEENHRALTLPVHKHGSCERFLGGKQEKKKTKTEKCSHIRMGSPANLKTSHGQYFDDFCSSFYPSHRGVMRQLQQKIKVLKKTHLHAHSLHNGEASEADAITKKHSSINKAAHSHMKALGKSQQFLKALQNRHSYQSPSPVTALNEP